MLRSVLLAFILLFSVANSSDETNQAITALYDSGDYSAAFKKARAGAVAGDLKAHEWLGYFYEDGVGVEANLAKAIHHYRVAIADSGQSYAQWRIGVLIDQGKAEGTLEEAFGLFELSAKQGQTEAMVSLGVMHATGRGTPQDFVACLESYMRAARAGESHGVRGVGVLFHLGQGVEQDTYEAAAWFGVAAAQGNEEAASDFGLLTEGMSKSEIEAIAQRANEIVDELSP